MSIASILEEIESLSAEDQARIRAILDANQDKRLDPSDLHLLSCYMVQATDPKEKEAAKKAIMRGFYGGQSA